jgi:dephospho-CoA kinase
MPGSSPTSASTDPGLGPTVEDGGATAAGVAAAHDSGVRLVGLTGGIAAGKSTALEALRDLGADVLSTDAVVHELYHCHHLIDALVERWGEEVAPEGVADRQAIAERAFSSDEELRWLERTIWPLVGERVAVWLALARAREPSPCAAIVEMPLLFESGMDRACDATIAIVAADEVRSERISEREHARMKERSARQLSQEEKAARATYVVHNDGDLDALRRELSGVLGKLCS